MFDTVLVANRGEIACRVIQALGPITLADGSAALGFHRDHATAMSAKDITHFDGWRNYLAR